MNISPVIAFKASVPQKKNVNDVKMIYSDRLMEGRNKKEALKEAAGSLCDIYADDFFNSKVVDIDENTIEDVAKGISFIDGLNKLLKKTIKENK